MNQKSIENMFTLRYDYTSKPFYPHKNTKDFEPWEEPVLGWPGYIQANLELKLWEMLNQYDTIGISLSSGLDSTLLLALTRKIFPKKKIKAFIDDCSGEQIRAEDQAVKYDARINLINNNSIFSKIEEYVKISKEPRYNVYHEVMAKTAKMMDCDILVTGDGADELFGGYIFRYNQFERNGDDYLHCHINDWVDDQSELLKDFSWFYYELMFGKRTVETLQHVLVSDYNGKLLHEFLPLSEKISKYHSIRIICPFMELRDIATHIPIKDNIMLGQNPVGKMVLRKIADNIGLKYHGNKIGYSIDITSEYQRNKDLIWKKLSNLDKNIENYINISWIKKHENDYDKRTINKFYQIFSLQEYLTNI